jgi:hypothetical protein
MNNIPLFKCRSSGVGKIMTNTQSKSNLDKYNDAVESLSNLEKRLESLVNKTTKTYIDISENKIPKTKIDIEELDLIKDKIQLSETTKQFLKEWILFKKYGRRKNFGNKRTEKGNHTEQDGFQVIQDVLFKGTLLRKNQEEFEDDYFTGVPDVKLPKFILDNKSSWDLFTFPIGVSEPPDKSNEPQIRTYMRLANLDNGLVCYTLNDTPTHLITDEIYYFKKKNNLIDASDQLIFDEVILNCVYTEKGLQENAYLYSTADVSKFIEIPKEKRLVTFQYERDLEIENQYIQRVKDCREWINENWDKF